MISLEILTFKNGRADGQVRPPSGNYEDVPVGYLERERRKLGKWKKSSPTIQKDELNLNLKVRQVI